MSTKALREFPGVVTNLLPNATFRIQLENGHKVFAHAGREDAQGSTRMLDGDKVQVEMTPHDLTEGRITDRFE
jgi:translation initiation factor IF-1